MYRYLIIALLIFSVLTPRTAAQVETAPANHQVYEFLHRMEVKRILPAYHGTVLPLPRKMVAEYLEQIHERRTDLRKSDLQLLDLFRLEFAYDLGYGMAQSTQLFGGGVEERFREIVSQKQKYLYAWYDNDGNALFIDVLAAVEHRSRTGDRTASLSLYEAGGRVRGTLGGRVGFYLDGINGVTRGDREFALEDQRLLTNSNYRLIRNDFYDESSGYIRIDATWFGIQLGRERMYWNTGYGNSFILSGNPPTFDFIRLDVSRGAVNYNFMHAWIMGPGERIEFDPERPPMPYNASKYFVAHRIEFSLFSNVLQIGLNESLIYVRESPELGYLNPVSFLITTERNLGDRDKLMLGLDFALRPVGGIELKFGTVFDDIHFGRSFTRSWDNRWAIHGGLYYADPFGLQNVDLFADYSRIEPHVYAHHRSPDRYYAHTDFLLGHPLGPNSDETTVKIVYRPQWQWRFQFEFLRQRHGDNIVDDDGNVVRNVGGDFRFSFRPGIDSTSKRFLDGLLTDTHRYRASVRYEIFKQFLLFGQVELANLTLPEDRLRYTTASLGIRVDY